MNVIDYVREEVRRQGHDVEAVDGIERVAWMLQAWTWAMETSTNGKPDAIDAMVLGEKIEPNKNSITPRTVGVRVGSRVCPHPQELQRLIDRLFENRDAMTPLEFYKEFELIHPFVDGNGRTGKVLLNWLNGTLLDPIFPPSDIFGHPNTKSVSEEIAMKFYSLALIFLAWTLMVGCAKESDQFPELTKVCIEHQRRYYIWCEASGRCWGTIFPAGYDYISAKESFTESGESRDEVAAKLTKQAGHTLTPRDSSEVVWHYEGGAQ